MFCGNPLTYPPFKVGLGTHLQFKDPSRDYFIILQITSLPLQQLPGSLVPFFQRVRKEPGKVNQMKTSSHRFPL